MSVALKTHIKDLLVKRVGLKSLAQMIEATQSKENREELKVALEAICNLISDDETLQNELGDDLDKLNFERESLIEQILDEICGLGPIQSLLDDPQVSEIMINGAKSLFYEKGGELYKSSIIFDSDDQIMLVIDRILAPLGRRLDRTSPLVSARLHNGDRVNAVAAPISLNGPAVTIRRFSRTVKSLGKLVELGALPAWYAQLLSWAVKARQAIAVAGGTGSGKTTLLNALSCEISHGERIITIEDSAELQFDTHPNVVRLEARDASVEGSGEITIRDLVKNALRMRPDRIVVGEVRGEECIDMLQAMNTGHDGSLTTLHAGSAQEAILRLILMARFGMDLPSDVIEGQIASALDLIVCTSRNAQGKRHISSLCEVGHLSDGKVELNECIRFVSSQGRPPQWALVKTPHFIEQQVQIGRLLEEEVNSWKSSILS